MVSRPDVLVVEYISGGGVSDPLPPDLVAEGAAMLAAVLADFRAWGRVETVTFRDPRLRGFDLPADRVIEVQPGALLHALTERIAHFHAVWIIAPESDGILARMTAIAERAGVSVLGSNVSAIQQTGDKWTCMEILRAAGLPVLTGQRISVSDLAADVDRLPYPVVVKPIDGVGCEGVCLLRGPADAEWFLTHVPQGPIIVQPYIEGVHASVSVLSTGQRCMALSVNRQDIVPGRPFRYRGGAIPLRHPLADHARDVACAAVQQFPGLRGYVGVDIILTDRDVRIVEINPRVTTAYVGLRGVLQENLAAAVWSACMECRLPERVHLIGTVTFRKHGTRLVVNRNHR